MNPRDPISESLDRLADLADTEPAGDRMPDIQRRVRATRRRRGATVVAAAAVLAVGGVGIWQGFPGETTAPAGHRRPRCRRSSGDRAWRPGCQGTNEVRISFTVTGESTAYADPGTGEATDYAGPRYTEVWVDGKLVIGSDGGDLACEPGGALTSYTIDFHRDEPLVVPMSPGGHKVVIKAPYCADGELVEDTEKVVVTLPASAEPDGFTVGDQLTADLDDDGADDDMSVLVPKDVTVRDQLISVAWGTGETTNASLPNTMTWDLGDPVDLDGDGDLELIAQGGGGDVAVGSVFQAEAQGGLAPVTSVDAAGKELGLVSDSDPSAWHIWFAPDGIYSYRLTDPATTDFPAPVEVRGWTLDGTTLTQDESSVTRCVTFQPTLSIGPC